MYTTDSEALPGPPFVMTNGSINSWKVPAKVITIWNSITGLSMGSVMRQNRRQGPAPSMVAASYRSAGMVCRPAVNSTMVKPVRFQMFMMTNACSTHAEDLTQGIGPRPTKPSR